MNLLVISKHQQLNLKLDANTIFEWQKFSQECIDVPHYQKILKILNLGAQASEGSAESKKMPCPEDRFKKNPSTKMSHRLLLVLQIYLPASVLGVRLREILCLLVLNSKVCHMKK